MIIINTNQLTGKNLNINIYSKQGSLLLPKNSILNEHHFDLLQQHGIELWAEDFQLATELIVDETVSEVQSIYGKILNKTDKISNRFIQRKLVPKIQELSINNSISNVILSLSKKDNYTYRHSIGVAVLSYLLGKWLGMEKMELKNLAIAGLLHDLGKIKISDSILNKPSRLSTGEYTEIKLHTNWGYELIRNLPEITEQQALVAFQHHEREDGSGYPLGVSGDQINYFSKIVAVADVFHTMISERVYKKPVPLYQVFQELYQHSFGLFDPTIVRCFIKNIMSKLVGDNVLLSDGLVARIVMIHPDDLINPLVEIEGRFYDLRKSEQKIMDFATNSRVRANQRIS